MPNLLYIMEVHVDFKDVERGQVILDCVVHGRKGICIGVENKELDTYSHVVLNRETAAQLAKHLRRTIHQYDLTYGIDGKKRLTL